MEDKPMTPIINSNVVAMGWKDNKLYVKIHFEEQNIDGYIIPAYDEIYSYSNVSLEEYEEMVNHSEAGKYVWNQLRGHKNNE